MSENTDTFDKICGDCESLDIFFVTSDDVREQGRYYEASVKEVSAAIEGLREYQEVAKEAER